MIGAKAILTFHKDKSGTTFVSPHLSLCHLVNINVLVHRLPWAWVGNPIIIKEIVIANEYACT